jgi:hypothetical protein
LSKFSIKGQRLFSILPGLIAGLITALLLTVPVNRQVSAPANSNLILGPSDLERLSPAELETLALKTLSTLREKRGFAACQEPDPVKVPWGPTTNSWQEIHLSIKNARRLLPLAKRLTLESLSEAQIGERLKTSGLSREERLINGVHKIVLDQDLGDSAEILDHRLTEIRIGPEYALALTSNDEAMLLLSHELTHVAARGGRLDRLIENVTEMTRLSAHVEPTVKQKEDLVCEFIGAKVLKRFIALEPTDEPDAERFSRAFGYVSPSERLARAWDDFCASYDDDPEDEDHLSPNQTIRALVGLDPELKALVPGDIVFSPLCQQPFRKNDGNASPSASQPMNLPFYQAQDSPSLLKFNRHY